MAENQEYLTEQIITYIGNKRLLISYIENEVIQIKDILGKRKLVCADLFSGSGIVARMLKQHSSLLIANDLENYSRILNSCYLTNKKDFDLFLYRKYRRQIEKQFSSGMVEGIISQNYAPLDTTNVKEGERAFYTRENALIIDTYRNAIEQVPEEYRDFYLAPLLTQASVHVNTSGVFKGFYKDKTTGIGCFGGKAKDALSRITGTVTLQEPVLSNYSCRTQIYQEDILDLSQTLEPVDIAYLDPPYNQHPYGSNYFMLNLIIQNKMPDVQISKISGIPSNWNRSLFNKRKFAFDSMEQIVRNLKAKYIIISYNSEGFITFDQMTSMLQSYGNVKTVAITYNTFRGSRNLKARDIHVKEYLFVLEKNI